MSDSQATPSVVMIVDDHPNNLKVLGGMLQQAGYKVRPALSGELALGALQTALPDLILLDIRMPDMDGYEVCRRLKADPRTASVPIIFISALHDMEDKLHAFEAGGLDYIVKPFQLEEVLARVHTHLALSQAQRALQSLNDELEQRVSKRTHELEQSNQRLDQAANEERVLGELLVLGLAQTAVADFLQQSLASLNAMVAQNTPDARLCLLLDPRNTLLETIGLNGDRPLPAHLHSVGLDRITEYLYTAYKQDEGCPFSTEPCCNQDGQVCHHHNRAAHLVPVQIEDQMLGAFCHHELSDPGAEVALSAFLERASKVISMGVARRLADTRVAFLAYHDELTGLPNRRMLGDRLSLELARSRHRHDIGALLLIDLDRFKTVNDALGHATGDRYLNEISRLFRAALREEDVLSRWGGDEFLVLLPGLGMEAGDAARQAHQVASILSALLAQPIKVGGNDLQLDASIGIALFPLDGHDETELLSHVDAAMYQAKQAGRHTICFYEAHLQSQAEQRLTLEKKLRQALERNEFVLHYQPQTDANGSIVGTEALVRWQAPEHGMVSPAEFIPIAEESGLIVPIGTWVLRTALAQQVRWQADPATHALATVSVNVSSRQFHRDDFVEQVEQVLAETGVDPHQVELEVTESLLIDDVDDVIHKMIRLKSLGIRFAVDDFGTGYSSLSYLKRLPLDRLKIDQSFVRNVHQDPQDAAIVGTIIAMAQHLNLDVIAEGVETGEEWSFLRASGCPAFQGYLFGRPIAAELLAGQLDTTTARRGQHESP